MHIISTAVPLQINRSDDCDKKKQRRSSAFRCMYHSVIQHLQDSEVKGVLYYLTDPHHPNQPCVPSSVYKDTTTTKELLDKLFPEYVNPIKTFVLEEIVGEYGSQECKELLREYIEFAE